MREKCLELKNLAKETLGNLDPELQNCNKAFLFFISKQYFTLTYKILSTTEKSRFDQKLKHVLAEECTRPLLCPLYLPLAALPLASLKAFQQQQLTTTTRPGQSGYELCVIMVAKQHSLTTCSTLASFSCFLWAYKMQSPAVPNREKGLLCCA